MMQLDQTLKELYQSDSVDKNIILDFYHPEKRSRFCTWASQGMS